MNAQALMEQRDSALAIANALRLERSRLRHAVIRRETTVPDLLRDPPECLASTPEKPLFLTELMTWQRGWGHVRAEKYLEALQMSPWARLEDLSRTRREQLARRMEEGL